MQFEKLIDMPAEEALFIAGPCSAESEQQVVETAKKLASAGVTLFRAGIWKPRTRPNAFEGVGKAGLKWLNSVQRETGLKVATEVANASHVEAALKHGIDVLWIGARTTVNPFSVQEIANALRGSDVPVMVKNPINPDLNLWIGALERIYQSGIRKIAAVHRGFSVSGETTYRNQPRWHIPIELKRRFPDLQIICDSSHICGNRHMLEAVAQRALDLDFDGIMMEVHPNPNMAQSDREQQLTPEAFIAIMKRLVHRRPGSDDPVYLNNIKNLRAQIDEIDEEVFHLYAQRMRLAEKIAELKKPNNISILQPIRWDNVLTNNLLKCSMLGLSEEFGHSILSAVHMESINHQSAVMNAPAIPADSTNGGTDK